MTLAEFFERFVFTRKCASCSTLLPYERKDEAFCGECRMRWDVLKTKECKLCGRAFCECVCMTKPLANAGALCHHKVVGYSLSEGAVHNTVMFLKRNKNPRVTAFLAGQLHSVLLADKELPPLNAGSAVITFVPRSRSTVTRYGVDQSEELARALAGISKIPFTSALTRVRGGREQKKLTASERLKNTKKLFCPSENIDELVGGKTVILVDDVVTTGASMAACVHHLIRARAGAVICLSVASTPRDK